MCDYSLQHLASRPAKVGDKLVTTKFKYSITGGFAAVDDLNTAVCLLPGTEIAFDADVECDPVLRFLPSRKVGARVARFRRINEEHPSMHHDALEFPGDRVVLLTHLREGQRATVLQLPAAQRSKSEAPAEQEQRPSTVLSSV